MREKYQVVVHKFVVSTHLATEKKKKTSEFHAPRRLEPGSEVENDVGTCGNELLTLRTPQATTGRIQFPEAGQSRPSGNLVERVCLWRAAGDRNESEPWMIVDDSRHQFAFLHVEMCDCTISRILQNELVNPGRVASSPRDVQHLQLVPGGRWEAVAVLELHEGASDADVLDCRESTEVASEFRFHAVAALEFQSLQVLQLLKVMVDRHLPQPGPLGMRNPENQRE